jgi:DNA-binding FrmR family transcriptional regulator
MTGYAMDKEQLLARLARVEGQVRGIIQMVEDDRYCIDVLTQIAAATKAMQGVAIGLLDDHLRHCVAEAVGRGERDADEKFTEATAALARLVRA